MSERNLPGADRLILIAAFRYALGRMTYMVDHVASFIEANAERIDPRDRYLIIREIDEAKERGGLGMDMDDRRWMRVREHLNAVSPFGPPPAGFGEHERRHREFMRRSIDAHRDSADAMPGLRCGLGDAAHLADAIGRDILAERVGARGEPTILGKMLAAVATRVGEAIWAARQETYETDKAKEAADV